MAMYPKNMFFKSESVTEGHPDKFCDQISDAVLDECLKQDPESRVSCTAYLNMGLLIVGGEITSTKRIDLEYKLQAAEAKKLTARTAVPPIAHRI